MLKELMDRLKNGLLLKKTIFDQFMLHQRLE